jgi:branched-chain amino acid transport system ATP-binding protein
VIHAADTIKIGFNAPPISVPDRIMLAIEKLHCGYGDPEPVHGVSLTVSEGEIFALLGPNGAGKTSVIMTIAGHVSVFGGRIEYLGSDLTSLAIPERVANGSCSRRVCSRADAPDHR